MKRHIFIFAKILLVCTIGVVIGWYGRNYYQSQQPNKLIEIRENDTKYHYINPLLLVDSPKEAPEYSQLKKDLNSFISSEKTKKEADSVSVYIRDLNSGKWTGIDQDSLYDPSSMLKVAVMLGYLNKADTDPNVLSQKLDYTAIVDPGQNYKPEHPLQNGSYTVRDLIEAMIIDSDNNALNVLYNNDKQSLADVLKSLSIPPPSSIDQTDFMSPKTYSSIFRTLYSSTFLSRELSEQTLQLLSYTNFKNGLVAGLPKNMIVAHKFGEHTSTVNGVTQSRQLHDCGIVYYPEHPYLLCVMTRGQDFKKLEYVISNISRTVYSEISAKDPVQINTSTSTPESSI